MKKNLLCLLFLPISSLSHILLFPALHSDSNSKITISFSHLESHLSNSPTMDFSLLTRYYFETLISFDSASVPIRPLFELENSFYAPISIYHKNSTNKDQIELNGTLYDFLFHFGSKDSLYLNDLFICFDFSFNSTLPNGLSSYNLSINIYFHDYDQWKNSSAFVKHTLFSWALILQDLSLILNADVTPDLKTKIYHVKIHKNDLSANLLSSHSWDNFYEIYYQLFFYQEPSKSKLLFNHSKYTFAPAINGDFSEQNNEVHSFFAESLNQTFWMVYESVRPQFIQLPPGLLSFIDSEYFDIKFFIDFYILTEDLSYANTQMASYSFTIISFLDKNGQEVFSISHRFNNTSFNVNVSYTISFHFSVDGVEVNDHQLLNTTFRKTSNTHLRLQFHKVDTNETRVVVYHCWEDMNNISMFAQTLAHHLDEFDQIILGKRGIGKSANPLFAYSLKSFHIFLNRYRLFYSASQSFKAFHGMNLVPYHNQFISDLWFLPENPDELAVYETKLSSLNDTDIEFTGIACPSNCEICYEPSTCVVCSVFFFLNGRKQCDNGVYLDQITYSVFGRERLSEANLFLSGDPPNLPASINHSFLTIRILINQDSSQLVSNSERHCEFVNNNGAVVFDSINWDFNNQSVTPYSDFKYSLENKVFYVTMDLDSGMKDIQKGNCEINSNFNAFLNDGACVIAYTSNASLKGFMGIKYCSGVYINIGESSHMIKPESNKTIGHDEYLMKIPGTSSFAYGKCRNNCKCWDGDIDTLQGYNSCFVNPDTGKVCADGFGLLNYGLDYSRQACVSQAFLDSYQLVYEPLCFAGCKVCDSSKNCIECDTPSFNRNYIDLFKGFLYCGACHVSCFTCSGHRGQSASLKKTSSA